MQASVPREDEEVMNTDCMSDNCSDTSEEEEEQASDADSPSEGSVFGDLEGLLEYLRDLKNDGQVFTEVVYIVNDWTLGGIIPLQHHGFVMKSSDNRYLSLDFCRQGIDWCVADEPPDLPDETSLIMRYHIKADPLLLEDYCAGTEPFSWLDNNCRTWALGLHQQLNLDEVSPDDISPSSTRDVLDACKVSLCYPGDPLQDGIKAALKMIILSEDVCA